MSFTNMEVYDWGILSVTYVCISWVIWVTFKWSVPEGFPPGPRPWPIIGHLPFLAKNGKNLPKAMLELSKTYGPVIGLKVFWQNYVFINDYESSKEAFVEKSKIFAGRPDFLYVLKELLSSEGRIRGVLFSSGDIWKHTRRFCKRSMKEFGVGSKAIENIIHTEMNFVSDIMKKNGKKTGPGINMDFLLKMAMNNIMSCMNFGHRFDYFDKDFQKMISIVENISSISFVSPINIFPLLRFSPISFWFWKLMREKCEMEDFINNEIKEHRQSFNANKPRDMVDLYLLKEMEADKDDVITGSDLKRAIVDLFMSGTDTTTTGISWFLLHMLHRPEIQKRCQEELDSVIGPDETLSMEDYCKLPYLNAVIYETQRCTSLSALGVTRSPNKTTTLNDYVIPKNSIVMPNVYAIHRDKMIWENPEEFNPDRWLDGNGQFILHKGFMLWGFSPRKCIGENYSKTQLFLIIGTLLKRFEFSSATFPVPPLEGKQGIIFVPPAYKVHAVPRICLDTSVPEI